MIGENDAACAVFFCIYNPYSVVIAHILTVYQSVNAIIIPRLRRGMQLVKKGRKSGLF